MMHEQAQPGDRFWGFVARDGTTEWREFSLPDEDRQTTVESIKSRIACVDEKIARLTADRDFYAALARKREAEEDPTNPACDLTGDSSTNSSDAEEILAIVAEIKARTKIG